MILVDQSGQRLMLVPVDALRKCLQSLYNGWHQCALRQSEGKAKKGTLCDVCSEVIEATLFNLGEEP